MMSILVVLAGFVSHRRHSRTGPLQQPPQLVFRFTRLRLQQISIRKGDAVPLSRKAESSWNEDDCGSRRAPPDYGVAFRNFDRSDDWGRPSLDRRVPHTLD